MGEGIWLTESGAVWLSTSTNFTDVLGTSFAVGLAHEERCGWLSTSFADVRMALEEQCGIGSVADDERFCGKATTSA